MLSTELIAYTASLHMYEGQTHRLLKNRIDKRRNHIKKKIRHKHLWLPSTD